MSALEQIGRAMPVATTLQGLSFAGPALARQATAVVIPALNEEARIGACLAALARDREDLCVVVVANDCTDGTAEAARVAAERAGLALCVVEAGFHGRGNAGVARRLGMAVVQSLLPGVQHLLTSDADCTVCPGWVANSIAHLGGADAVCGHVIPEPEEERRLPWPCVARAEAERAYTRATLEFESLVSPDAANPWPHHGQAPGASLGFTRAAYVAAGGFANMDCGEDREIIQRLKRAGRAVVHAADVGVVASCRVAGRARGGMADRIARHIAEPDSLCDERLMPAHAHLARAERALRGGQTFRLISPVPRSLRLLPWQLPGERARLTAINAALGAVPAAARGALLTQMRSRGADLSWQASPVQAAE
ncbi:glycosyltransferase family A protein [Marinovum sp.]|uniref:glycosyltransferase n=1 Tax=Marinovum sp. TaxID=2024839 RepID=UPI002B267442|nr:glycosyltransferase family A protein [Marinovum sp.]